MLSVLTMMFLGNHIPNCQENQNKSVLLLFMALVGNHVSFEEEIAGKITNLVSFDRGYMTEEMVRKLSFLGIVLLGTLKRCFFFHHTRMVGLVYFLIRRLFWSMGINS